MTTAIGVPDPLSLRGQEKGVLLVLRQGPSDRSNDLSTICVLLRRKHQAQGWSSEWQWPKCVADFPTNAGKLLGRFFFYVLRITNRAECKLHWTISDVWQREPVVNWMKICECIGPYFQMWLRTSSSIRWTSNTLDSMSVRAFCSAICVGRSCTTCGWPWIPPPHTHTYNNVCHRRISEKFLSTAENNNQINKLSNLPQSSLFQPNPNRPKPVPLKMERELDSLYSPVWPQNIIW